MDTERLCILFDKDGNPIKALFNENKGKIIPINVVYNDKQSELFLDGYANLTCDPPKFDNISKKIWKVSRIPMYYIEQFSVKKK